MLGPRRLRLAFLLFHLVLGTALLWASVHTVRLVGVHGDARGSGVPATRVA